MTTKQVINDLLDSGYSIKYIKRKDGGVRVTSVNGRKFKGSEGNRYIRSISPKYKLSEKGLEQRRSNYKKYLSPNFDKTRKGYASLRKTVKVNDELNKKLRKVQRLERLSKENKGKTTKDKLRWKINEHGERSASQYLDDRIAYLLGYAYQGAIVSTMREIERIFMFENIDYDLDKFISRGYGVITEDQIEQLLELKYEYDKQSGVDIDTTEIINAIIEILDSINI